jgi:signal transduction histidine kinase
MEISLFRILQEALNNASKYAKATTLRISLACDRGDCKMEIEDDGVGFLQRDVRPKSHGLVGMRQRLEPQGGRFELRSEPGRGTLVRAIIPIR